MKWLGERTDRARIDLAELIPSRKGGNAPPSLKPLVELKEQKGNFLTVQIRSVVTREAKYLCGAYSG